MNYTFHIGNLVRDPETKVTTTGKQQTKFTIAVNRKHVDKDGKRQADFIRYTCYDKLAENVAKYLAKGRKCQVTGHVRTGSYEKDGQTVYTTEFIADDVEFLSPSKQDGQEAQEQPQAPAQSAPPQQTQGEYNYPQQTAGEFIQVDEEELPF